MAIGRTTIICGALVIGALFLTTILGSEAEPPVASWDCFGEYDSIDFADCFSYVKAGSQMPRPLHACCRELSALEGNQPICFCQTGVHVDLFRTFNLPMYCDVNLTTHPITVCSGSSHDYFPTNTELFPFTDHIPTNTESQASYIIPVMFLGACILAIILCFVKHICATKKGTSTILPTAVAQPASNLVPVWEVDAPTMERFLQELAREKAVRFTSQQLCIFTSNYSTRLGSGGFGVVYKGQFPNGVKIAVKVLNRNVDRAAEEQFRAEVGTIGRTYHINLVRLYGFCYDGKTSALVYEYMENGSLDKYLFSNKHNTIIEWEKLHEIAVGTAKGIAYLHEECEQRIIHYDIKPGNVLLDANFSPKVADFGLAKLCNRDHTHVTVSGYRGTPGYSAPEFLLKNFPVTHKCDVYSFGILLFEIVGRRRNPNVGSTSTDSLDWFPKQVWDGYEKGDLAAMILRCGIDEKDRVKAERMCMVALWCVQDSPDARPLMSAVVKMLEEEVAIMRPPKPFQYLFSVKMDALKSPSNYDNSSDYSTSEETDSNCYKECTPLMAKYEIQLASS